jgi:hypothetical protein
MNRGRFGKGKKDSITACERRQITDVKISKKIKTMISEDEKWRSSVTFYGTVINGHFFVL